MSVMYRNGTYYGKQGGGGAEYTAGDGIDISNNEISTDRMVSSEIDDLDFDEPTGSEGGRSWDFRPGYKREVGYWKDRKVIYKHFIEFSLPTIADEGRNAYNITLEEYINDNIESFVDIRARLVLSTGANIVLPAIDIISGNILRFIRVNGNNYTHNIPNSFSIIYQGISAWSGSSMTIEYYYTKADN